MGYLHSGLNGADQGQSAALKAEYQAKQAEAKAQIEAEEAAYNKAHPEEVARKATQADACSAFWALIESAPAKALTQLKALARNGMVPCVKNPYESCNPAPVRIPGTPTKLWEDHQHGWTYYPYWED